MYQLAWHLGSILGLLLALNVPGVISISSNGSRLSWQCWPEDVGLFADLACSLNGTSYVVGSHYPSSDDAIPSSTTSDFSPWTFRPVCSDILEAIHSELCVYTSGSFAGGRGISIITTPTIAEGIAQLIPLKIPAALDGLLHSNLFRITPRTPLRGRSGLSRQDLETGDEVASKVPIVLMHEAMLELSWPEHEEFLRVAILRLPLTTQRLLGLLSSNTDRPELVLSG